MEYFPEKQWTTVYPGGMINVRTSEKGHTGFDFVELLELVSSIKRLRVYPGFNEVLKGLKNPPQIQSTIFELRVADWCHRRALSESVSFGPSVTVRSAIKHPDFLWQTKLGPCYCECKRANFLDNAANARLSRMTGLLDTCYKGYSKWDDQLRLDVTFGRGTSNRLQRQLAFVVEKAQAALRELNPLAAIICSDRITAQFRPRSEDPPAPPDTVRQYRATTGTVATDLKAAAYLSLSIDLTSYRSQAVAHLVRDAISQLPAESPGLIFIEGTGHVSAMQRLRALLTSPTYGNTPWVSLWAHGECRGAVWRNGQPLDGALLK